MGDNLYLKCNQIPELNDIKQGINVNDNIPDILQNILNNTQQILGDRIECRILASIYKCILSENNAFTTSTSNELPDLQDNQVAIIYLTPPIASNEYHFITIYPIGDNYRIYSVNGRVYIPTFEVNKIQFMNWYQQLMQLNPETMKYNKNINEIPIAKAWNGLTGDNLQQSFNNSLIFTSEDSDEEFQPVSDEEKEEYWDDYMNNMRTKQISPKIVILTRNKSSGGFKRKRKTNKRRTNKRRKTNKRRTNKRRYSK